MSASLLANIPFFADLSEQELKSLEEQLSVVKVASDQVLFREGDVGDSLLIVVDGELHILIGEGSSDEMLLNVLGPGEYLGEMSLIMPGGQRTASARATKPTVLLELQQQEFNDLLHRQPSLAYGMARVLSQRLDSTNNASYRDLVAKNQQLQKAYNDLKAAQAQLVEKERLEKEIQVAAGIQMSILPDKLPDVPGFDFGACISPARMVGGDFYDVFPVGPDTIAVLIGDVADKGIPAAIFMARAHALIISESAHGGTPGDILQEVNAHITRLEKTPQFVTALYGHLDCKTGEFSYARAGHEPPFLLTADGQVERLAHSPGMSLGLMDSILIDERSQVLPPGSSLLLFSDGLTDCRNPQGELFGLERSRAALSKLAGLSARQVCDQVMQDLNDYQDGSAQDDDVTLVAVHVA
jgi:sigma-B regulation protein RsbU (phosphoserine phosphatase)